jgi:hypothetical protein
VSEREPDRMVVGADAERVIKASGEYRSGTHVISVSMEPGYTPPSASMRPSASTPTTEAPPTVQEPAASAAPPPPPPAAD